MNLGSGFWDVMNEPDWPPSPKELVARKFTNAKFMANTFHELDHNTPSYLNEELPLKEKITLDVKEKLLQKIPGIHLLGELPIKNEIRLILGIIKTN